MGFAAAFFAFMIVYGRSMRVLTKYLPSSRRGTYP